MRQIPLGFLLGLLFYIDGKFDMLGLVLINSEMLQLFEFRLFNLRKVKNGLYLLIHQRLVVKPIQFFVAGAVGLLALFFKQCLDLDSGVDLFENIQREVEPVRVFVVVEDPPVIHLEINPLYKFADGGQFFRFEMLHRAEKSLALILLFLCFSVVSLCLFF